MERSEILGRLRQWTAGIDQASGEPLPLAHALRHAEVHATLVAALALLEAAVPPQRARQAGRTWSPDEEAELLRRFEAGASVASIAAHLERTRGAINARLVKLGRIEPVPGMRLRG